MAGSGFDMSLDFREARESDISDLVNLLADDALGAGREDISTPLNQRYLDAFLCRVLRVLLSDR